ncbi:hypothetical protein THAOC_10992, partial [Thalassiosira oceanica]
LLANVSPDSLIWRTETFGPVVAVSSFGTEEEAVELANDTASGLASYFCTRDMSRAFRVSSRLENGIVGVNEGIISNAAAPFGGVKESGMGREGSSMGLSEYLETNILETRDNKTPGGGWNALTVPLSTQEPETCSFHVDVMKPDGTRVVFRFLALATTGSAFWARSREAIGTIGNYRERVKQNNVNLSNDSNDTASSPHLTHWQPEWRTKHLSSAGTSHQSVPIASLVAAAIRRGEGSEADQRIFRSARMAAGRLR